MVFRILNEASGSFTSGYLIKAIKEAGHLAVASDVDPKCVGRYLADDFILMPHKNDPDLWEKTIAAVINHECDIILPSFDETILGWAERKDQFSQMGVHVIISEEKAVRTFQDKWLTYEFFSDYGIPTPVSSLEQKYSLVKPRIGRGSTGIKLTDEPINMDGMISQEPVEGIEYTVDVLCDRNSEPVYIIPRRRQGVKDGKSTGGVVVKHAGIIKWVKRICSLIQFAGPINLQCFECENGDIKFIEINTRIAGGMALGFAATENWINLIVDNFVYGKDIIRKPIKYGLEMRRYYAEVFIPPD